METHRKIRFLGLLLLAMSLLFVGQVAPTQAAANDNNVEWGGLGHDSRDPLYRSPSGAVTTGTPIRLRLRAFDNDLTSASVRVWNDRINVSTVYPMTRVAGNVVFTSDPNAYEFWEVTLPASALPTVYWYRFIANDGGSVAYYEDDGARTGGWGQAFAGSPDNSWQLTIYDSGFTTPSWVQNAVIYQVFPDRFRDGVPANNPSAGEFFYGNYDTIYRSNNTNWNTHICDPRVAVGSSSVCSGAYSQNFYGGDLQGIIDELDYIDALGVTAIYLNPIFESPSNHKYDTTDFFVIDDNFGILATFQTLVAQANARGINIILDGVFNHSSSDSVYFDRYGRWTGGSTPNVFPTSTVTGTNDGSGACETLGSTFTPWYTFFNYGGTPPAPCSDNRDYPKWFGIFDSLPVFQHDYGSVRDYFINNGVNSVGPYWISQGAAGWRLDVAPEVDHGTINDPSDDYWEDFRTALHAIDPNAYIVGEEWGNPTSWNLGGEWDATMNYQFGAAVLSFWRDSSFTDNDFNGGSSAGVLNPIDASTVNERLLNLEERYAPPAFYAMMNLFGSHDTNRALFLLDHNTGSNNTAQYNNPAYDWSDAITRLRGAALMQMTMPGAPTIYYGDEIGLVGPVAFDGSVWQDDPYNRQPYPWLDETGTPYYAHLSDVTARNTLYNYYALLTGTRNNNAALRTGSLDPLLMAGDLYAYGRKMADDSNTAVMIINSGASASPATVNVAGYIPTGAILTDALTSTNYTVNGSGDIVVGSVPARGGLLLILNSFAGRPSCITDLVAVSGAGTVDLSWSNATNATSYDIYRSRLSGGGYELLTTVGTNSHSDITALNATTYYYRVVGKSANLLTSEFFCNNEATATPALAIDWHALQWPPTITHTVSAITPTSTVYGQVYIAGVTDPAGQATGVIAQLGYGAENSTPDNTWTWFPTTFNSNSGNNDEYQGTMIVTATPGTYWYTYRWSTDGGVTWRYSQLNPPGGDYTSGNVGVMTLNAPADVTAPATPTTLAILATSTSSITLGWDAHPNTDGDLYGFRVYRENTASPGYALIQTVVGAGAVQYIDTTVTSGEEYNYYITAIDNNVNESAQSNIVTATAEARLVAVTFTATVPNPSPGTVHIVGNFNGWNPGDPAYAMTQVNATTWTITFDILDETSIEYKYARSDWLRGEKDTDGNAEIGNRMLTAAYGVTGIQARNDTVANWRDPLVVSTNPANGATGVPPGATLDIVWNQDMPASLSGVTVTGPSGVVTGTWAFNTASNISTFTPSVAMEIGTHTVAVIGSVDIAGDVQQVPTNYTFDVGLPAGMVAVTFSTTVPSHTPTDVYLVGGFGSAGYPEWNPAGILMTEVSPDVWEVTLILPDAGYFEYKYTRNDWSNEERDADGYSGGGNRNFTVADGGGQVQTVTNAVGNWRDPYVISVTPANASINNAPNSVVVITWNKNMPALAGTFSISDSVPSSVAGTITTGTNSHTFTPTVVLPDGAYSVAVSGNTDWNGNNQQVPFASTFSVSAIAGVDVTFSVTVPSHTPSTVYLVGDFGQIGQPNWVANGIAMTPVGGDVWQVTFNAVPVGTTFEYKYTRGSFDSVEKEADGNAEILGGANRGYVVPGTPVIADTVANWRDPYVISSVPADGANLTDGNTTISFTWNQDMPATLGGTFTILDSVLNPVAGTLTYDSPTDTHTFTPTTLPLGNEVYTIALSGNTDVNGDVQQFADGFSFTVTSALYDLGDAGNTWYTLQWPPTLTHTVSAVIPTGNIYGQIWINGVTGGQNGVDPTPGLIAEVGYGPDGTLPNDPAWVWFPTTFNNNAGNNDEYMGTLLPTAAGNFDYLYRYSADGGTTWYYGANTGPYRTLGAYNPADAGQLTVSASPDVTAPTAPTNLVLVNATDTQIQIGWDAHPNTDGDLYAFEVYRDGVLIDTIIDPLAVTYTDTTVVTGTTYAYTIVAVDTSFNASAPSNTVNATATTVVVVVTPPVNPGNPNPNPPANPPANPPGLIIRFENNNNFVGRGASRVLQLLFENISGQPLNGTLELVFPQGIMPSNASSPHGTPSIVQLIDEVFSFAKRMINTEQQNTPAQNVVRLNFGQIANGETVTLSVVATVDARFTQPSAIIEGRLIVNGAVVDTASALLVIDSNIVALPATGETPLWRDALLASLIGLAGFGVMFTIWRKRATA